MVGAWGEAGHWRWQWTWLNEIRLLAGEGGGEGLTGGVPEVAAVTRDRTIFCFLLDQVSIVRAVAAGFPATAGWGHATTAAAAGGFCFGSEHHSWAQLT